MEYKLKITKDDLYNKGFHYNKLMGDNESDFYSLCFPVHKYKEQTTIECELSVELQSGDVIINVYNYGTHDIYVPYYSREFGINDLVDNIDVAIKTQLKKLGVKQYE